MSGEPVFDDVELINEIGALRAVLTELVDALDKADVPRLDAAVRAARPLMFEVDGLEAGRLTDEAKRLLGRA